MVEQTEVPLDEAGVRNVEEHRFSRRGVPAQEAGECRVRLLVGMHSVGRMQVQGGPEPEAVQVPEKVRGIGEELPVPGVAGPAPRVRIVHQVPVHVDDADRQGNRAAAELLHQIEQRFPGVLPVAAPPVAQDPSGDQGNRTRDPHEIPDAPGIVPAVAEEVEVARPLRLLRRNAGAARHHPAVLLEDEGTGIVHEGPSGPGDESRFEGNRPVDVVQGAGGAAEVPGIGVPVLPGPLPLLQPDGERLRGERPVREPVPDQKRGGLDLQISVFRPAGLEVGNRQAAVPEHLARPVLESGVRGVFHPDQPVGQQGEADAACRDRSRRIRDRLPGGGKRGGMTISRHVSTIPTYHPFCKAVAGPKACLQIPDD